MLVNLVLRTRQAVVGTYTYLAFLVTALLFIPPMTLAWLLHRGDPTQRIPGRWMRRFGRTTARLTPVLRFSVEGNAPQDIADHAYVVVSNHESNLDPFLLSFLPWDMRWVAKQELFRVPLVGTLMRRSGDIPVRRGERDSVTRMLEACRRTLVGGCSVMMFPEGTRSRDGALLPFKDGAFALAIEAQVPVLPVALTGTRSCMVKGSPWLLEARAVARILEPIPTRGLGPADVAKLREQARAQIEAAVRELRATKASTEGEPCVEVAAAAR